MLKPPYGSIAGNYDQKSVKKRLEQFFVDNVRRIVTTNMLKAAAGNNKDGTPAENWHQRLSELRVNDGYTILSERDREYLGVGEYLLEDLSKREKPNNRVTPRPKVWKVVLERADHKCEWSEGGIACGLKSGEVDPIGGGNVKLTADHKTPHSSAVLANPDDSDDWQALCGRHQVTKRNYWDTKTGKLNVEAILQAASQSEKRSALLLLLKYFELDVDLLDKTKS